ncbi:hypothetical protein, partial [Dendronalium phyllosphericum]|uniref:hypothetical protein n=1 Tax=Dendronalium phyllosphericum TaxID=2840445 RepID=UPI001BDCDFA3
PRIYYPLTAGPFTITPEAAFIGIAYSDSPGGGSVGQALGDLSINAQTSFYKCYGPFKHVIEPYFQPHFLT